MDGKYNDHDHLGFPTGEPRNGRKKKALINQFELDMATDSDDVFARMTNETNGEEIVFLTAPANLFEDGDLGPLVTRLGNQVVLAYNSDVMYDMIGRSVERNADEFGEAAAAFLPMSSILSKGMRIALDHLNK